MDPLRRRLDGVEPRARSRRLGGRRALTVARSMSGKRHFAARVRTGEGRRWRTAALAASDRRAIERPASVTRLDLVPLVYELLDAHDDTARLAVDLSTNPRWSAHLDYLRDLQRVAREALAQQEAGA